MLPVTPAQPGPPPRTARNALIAAVLIGCALVLGAQLFSGGWTSDIEMTPYIKLGPRIGAQRLEADLVGAHPPGSGLGPLYARLHRMGFDCRSAQQPGEPDTCRFRARRGDDQVLTATVDLRHDGVLVQGIAARMALSAN